MSRQMLTFVQQVDNLILVGKMTTIKDFKTFDENPFEVENIVERDYKYGGKDKRVVDDSGVVYKMQELSSEKYLSDTREFRKVYKDTFSTIKDLSTPALRIFCYIALKLKINKDEIYIDMSACNEYCGYDSRQPFYKGIVELLQIGIIARKVGGDHNYYINTNLLFNGNRTKLND